MTKKLNELYAPKPKGEKDFVDLHKVKKTTDKSPSTADSNNLFNAGPKVKTFQRKVYRFGYDAPDDEKAAFPREPGPNDTNPPPKQDSSVYPAGTFKEGLD